MQLEERAQCERAFVILRDCPRSRRRRSTFHNEESDDDDSRNLSHFPGNSPNPGKESGASFSVGVVGQSERLPAVRIEVRVPSMYKRFDFPLLAALII